MPHDRRARLRVSWPQGRVALRSLPVADGVTFTAEPIRVRVGAEARFSPYATEVRTTRAPVEEGLEALSPLYRFADGWQPARGASAVGLRPPPGIDPSDAALYLEDGGRWWRLGTRLSDGRVWGGAIHLTGFALMRDTWPPDIGAATVEPHPAGARLVIPVDEKPRGLASFQLMVDGAQVQVEWQPAHGRLLYRPWTPFTPGEHTARVRVADRAGWSSEAELDFSVPEATAPPDARSR